MSLTKKLLYNLNVTNGKLLSNNLDINTGTINNLSSNVMSGGNLSLSGNLVVGGALTTVNITTTNISETNVSAGTVTALNQTVTRQTVSNSIITNQTISNLFVSGNATFGSNTVIVGPAFQLPSGNIASRPIGPLGGYVRYNTETQQFEGYGPGNAWGSLGGVVDIAQTTKVLASASPSTTDGNLYFYTVNNERMRINSVGNVGIGTTAPNALLDVAGSLVSINSSFTNTTITNLLTTNASVGTINITNQTVGSSFVSGNATFGSNVVIVGPAFKLPSGNNASRPAAPLGGYVRYNTETQQFEGYGPGNAWGSLGGVVDIAQTTKVLASASPSTTDGNLYFFTVGNERMRINSVGNVGIGTTTPGALLEVAGGFSSTTATITNLLTTNVTTATLNASIGITAASVQITNANVTTSTIANLLNTNVVSTTITTATLNASTGITAASAQITNANVTTSTIANLLNTNVVSTNITTATLNASTGITAASAQITNANVTTQTVSTSRITTSLLALGNTNTLGNIFTTGGNVGINIISPAYHLDVNGNVHVNANLYVDGLISGGTDTGSTFAYLTLTSSDDATNLSTGSFVTYGGVTIQSPTDAESVTNGGSFLTEGGAAVGKRLFVGTGLVSANNSNTVGNVFTTGGNVGVGTTDPAHVLDINGGFRSTTATIPNIFSTNITAATLNVSGGITSANARITSLTTSNLVSNNLISNNVNLGISSLFSGSFSASNNTAIPANVTGFAFVNADTRYFQSTITVTIIRSVGGNLYQNFTIDGVQTDSGWGIYVSKLGDDTGFDFTITSNGQVQYTSTNLSNFTSSTIRYSVTQISNTGSYSFSGMSTQGTILMDSVQIQNTQNSIVGTNTGSLYVLGGSTLAKTVNILTTENAVGLGTGGAFTVFGGSAVSKDLYVGGSASVSNIKISGLTDTLNVTATNISTTTMVATNYTGGSMNLSGNLVIGGTLTTVNITSSNIVDTNISTGTLTSTNQNSTNVTTATLNASTGITTASAQITNVNVTTETVGTSRITTSLIALGNSNTIGNIFTTGGSVCINTTSVLSSLNNSLNVPSIQIGNRSDRTWIINLGGSGTVDSRRTGLLFGDGTNMLIANQEPGYTLFSTNNTDRMIITSSGNVGIGTTSPSYKIDVFGSSSVRGSMNAISTNNDIQLAISPDNGNYITVEAFNVANTVKKNICLVPWGGSIGIGTVNPLSVLHVYSSLNTELGARIQNANTGSSAYSMLRIGNSINDAVMFLNSSTRTDDGGTNTFTIRNDTGGAIRLQGGGLSNILWLSTGGNIGIGTTTPNYGLHVSSYGGTGSVPGYAGWYNHYGWQNQTVAYNVGIYSQYFIMSGEGFVSVSDQRIKKDITDIDDGEALNLIRQIEPKRYRYIDEYKRGTDYVYGFIAQQVRSVLPYASGLVKDFIPSIMTPGTVTYDLETDISTVTLVDDKHHNLTSENIRSQIRFFDNANNQKDLILVEIVSTKVFRVKGELDTVNSTFVYGIYIEDFHTLNKDSVFTVAVAALQEVDRKLQTETASHQETKIELAQTKQQLQSITETVDNLLTQLRAKYPGEF